MQKDCTMNMVFLTLYMYTQKGSVFLVYIQYTCTVKKMRYMHGKGLEFSKIKPKILEK